LTVSARRPDAAGFGEVTLSLLPHLLGDNGAIAALPLDLSDVEHHALLNRANVIRAAIDALSL